MNKPRLMEHSPNTPLLQSDIFVINMYRKEIPQLIYMAPFSADKAANLMRLAGKQVYCILRVAQHTSTKPGDQ